MSDIVKQGYVKFQSKNLGVWKKRWIMLRMKSGNGPLRLEKYKDENAALMGYGAERRIIDLTRLTVLERLSESVKKHAIIVVVEGSEAIQFHADSEMEAETWLKTIKAEVDGAGRSRGVTVVGHDSDIRILKESIKFIKKNHPDSLIDTYHIETFPVYLMKNPKLATHGDCTMQITPEDIRLLDHRNNEIVHWPLNKLRRYGVERTMFTIEAGRSCPTGEGTFVFDCQDAESVYQRVHDLTRSLAQAQRSGGNVPGNARPQQSGNSYGGSQQTNGFSQANWGNPSSIQALTEPGKSKKSKENDYAYGGSASYGKPLNNQSGGSSQYGASQSVGGGQYGGSQYGASQSAGGSQYCSGQYGGTTYEGGSSYYGATQNESSYGKSKKNSSGAVSDGYYAEQNNNNADRYKDDGAYSEVQPDAFKSSRRK